jgi:uncharacterized membrane protein YdbT with pleckstrin-like domain
MVGVGLREAEFNQWPLWDLNILNLSWLNSRLWFFTECGFLLFLLNLLIILIYLWSLIFTEILWRFFGTLADF